MKRGGLINGPCGLANGGRQHRACGLDHLRVQRQCWRQQRLRQRLECICQQCQPRSTDGCTARIWACNCGVPRLLVGGICGLVRERCLGGPDRGKQCRAEDFQVVFRKRVPLDCVILQSENHEPGTPTNVRATNPVSISKTATN